MTNLWTIHFNKSQPSLPLLIRTGTKYNQNANIGGGSFTVYDSTANQAVDIIDVVNTFPWTKSPTTARYDVPTMWITEKRIVANSSVSNIANAVLATADSASSAAQALAAGGDALINVFGGGGNTLTGLVSAQVSSVQQAVKQYLSQQEFTRGLQLNNPALDPYEFLYITENTGFKYSLPYFDDALNGVSMQFGEDNDPSIVSGIASIASNIADFGAHAFGALKPGTYIERSKQFNMSGQGRSVTVKFPLLNTESFDQSVTNWQLVFGLIFQNKPGRVTRNIIDLPVIYEVLLPGVAFMPYAYISNMSVQFAGTRRLMSIPVSVVDQNGTTLNNITTTIPDAYQVSITFTGLNDDTRNFMFASLQRNVVTVSAPPPPITGNINGIPTTNINIRGVA